MVDEGMCCNYILILKPFLRGRGGGSSSSRGPQTSLSLVRKRKSVTIYGSLEALLNANGLSVNGQIPDR